MAQYSHEKKAWRKNEKERHEKTHLLLNKWQELKVASEDPEVRQDPDIKDKKGTQPAKYYANWQMSKSTKSARRRTL